MFVGVPEQDDGLQEKWYCKVEAKVGEADKIELKVNHENTEVSQEHDAVGSERSS